MALHLARDDEKEQNIGTRLEPLPGTPQRKGGFPWEWLKEKEFPQKFYSCGLCKKLCDKAVVLTCASHPEETGIFCKKCMEDYLKENNNSCPLKDHKEATYTISTISNIQIGRLIVICPTKHVER